MNFQRKLFRISVLLVLGQLLYKTVTQQCGSEVSIFGWMLRRHIYNTMFAELPHTCVQVCREDDRCQSFNWVISLLKCEFSNRTKEARPEDFISDPDRFYYKRDRNSVPLGSIPGLPAETCLEIKKSEGHAISRKYWFSSIKTGTSVLAYCDMTTEACRENSLRTSLRYRARFQTSSGHSDSANWPGYEADVDECTSSVPLCHVNATCTNNDGSYICTCKNGFSGDGKTCKAYVRLSVAINGCVGRFTALYGYALLCTAMKGYVGLSKQCLHIYLSPIPMLLLKVQCMKVTGTQPGTAGKTGTTGTLGTAVTAGTIGTLGTAGTRLPAGKADTTGARRTAGPSYYITGSNSCLKSLFFFYIFISECQNYASLNNARKITYSGYTGNCDYGIGPGWFRFEGSAGMRMASSCPPTRRCGTNAPGWMNGGHPTVADGQVSRQVCFHWSGNCCLWSRNIKVRNCGSYYVYYLSSPPTCNLCYCGTD
ncbi:unnamed protein product [Porites evermanni]|uniref:EGF-like domain-containing protein n=1 Tax=Porites evermanni TaxID=104178 RepID=A0ABN8REG5_9CNID|nr:unnamed protein product [Porites evermanni]